jgi:hypothetical protein
MEQCCSPFVFKALSMKDMEVLDNMIKGENGPGDIQLTYHHGFNSFSACLSSNIIACFGFDNTVSDLPMELKITKSKYQWTLLYRIGCI